VQMILLNKGNNERGFLFKGADALENNNGIL